MAGMVTTAEVLLQALQALSRDRAINIREMQSTRTSIGTWMHRWEIEFDSLAATSPQANASVTRPTVDADLHYQIKMELGKVRQELAEVRTQLSHRNRLLRDVLDACRDELELEPERIISRIRRVIEDDENKEMFW
jgi:hypothetical protein